MGRRKGRRERGHFCWCCNQQLPNERFSGRGHRDHVCRDCKRLPREERAFRQAVRDMERLIDWDGRIRRRARPQLDPFLEHSEPRVREYAEALLQRDAEVRAEIREAYRREREAMEARGREFREEVSWNRPPETGCWTDLPF